MTVSLSRTGVVVLTQLPMSTRTRIDVFRSGSMPDRSTVMPSMSLRPAIEFPLRSRIVTEDQVSAGKVPSRLRMSHFLSSGRKMSSVTRDPLGCFGYLAALGIAMDTSMKRLPQVIGQRDQKS